MGLPAAAFATTALDGFWPREQSLMVINHSGYSTIADSAWQTLCPVFCHTVNFSHSPIHIKSIPRVLNWRRTRRSAHAVSDRPFSRRSQASHSTSDLPAQQTLKALCNIQPPGPGSLQTTLMAYFPQSLFMPAPTSCAQIARDVAQHLHIRHGGCHRMPPCFPTGS